jgi:hypothetical protein
MKAGLSDHVWSLDKIISFVAAEDNNCPAEQKAKGSGEAQTDPLPEID